MIADILSLVEDKNKRNTLSVFYENNKERFFRIAYSRLHNKEDSEDAIQETFLRLISKFDRFFEIPDEKKVAFTDVILRNVACEMINKRNKYVSEDFDVELYDDNADIEERALDNLKSQELIDFIAGLPDMQKNVMELKIFHELSNREIARILNVDENVVNQRIFQARKSIQKYLTGGR